MSHNTTAPAPTAGLVVDDLTVSFRRHRVLDNISLRARPGRVYALLGLNGAGKSTLFNAVLGLVKPDDGRIRVQGRDWDRACLDDIGASVNGPALYPQLSATNNLLVHARLTGTDPSVIPGLLEEVGLAHTGRKHARSFSTGMKVRLALAIALLTDPPVLLLDEPQNGLDPQGISYLRELIRRLADEGKSVIISSHQLSEVARMADDIGVLAGGRIVYEGPLTGLTEDGESLERAFMDLATGAAS
ncbi:MAG TPA: ATP-binding cassette domain-containing protein [Candidatus Corynebacterium avicola]|uniref:ATP-binding cassette domain-containing protein n=1 Tax=Candidatus Corynebacterium avicola TaxID=2838527 RepID=A0A9D1RQ19_9CORY|nr:ATP-binding cassette domain-containing protein [Candidatus Corynebacterium avicola]